MTPRIAWTDLLSALGLLSRLPLPAHRPRGAGAAWAYPVAGAILGGIAVLAGLAALALSLPPEVAALACLAMSVALTGALHEDGLADLADGIWGGATAERRLEIMKDSRVGTYGVVALVLSLLARWLAMTALFASGTPGAIIAAAALSRAAMPALMATMAPARATGLARTVGRPAPLVAWVAGLAGLACALPGLGTGTTLAAIAATALVAATMARLARARLGGITGDVLGATQQLAEIAVLFTALA